MENVVLSIHLILALLLIGVVLLQRSEGGGLGMGSSSSSSGVGGLMTGRQAANALTRVTWILAAGFFATSVTLTVLAAQKARNESVVDSATTEQSAPAATAPATPANDAPATPPALDVVMPPAPSGSEASTGGTSGETTTETPAGPVTPPASN
ncbi:MAG: preprotein translocase subunit SecG [Thioclava marina]|uniref:Protein-export membrane protein SecG n=1 Tax=Thioclava marina TaxID=1915077 RepID=A0ABX3MM04_9RHOB|nr:MULTISPECIES: preprotein translocase subunit SecG [Thioclava]MBC7146959.1 preprotein translocase subunit SecG [Thioclava marina]OOY11209.1 preprotein translocase subunit SecG [Thioclava marina]OOY26515.1 preprotein translocase subunit SecG [Thioclava sp. L04-15]TNE83389.1 MAG: preprotein translocase subunit SecG [Paracoccaceae bacterium]